MAMGADFLSLVLCLYLALSCMIERPTPLALKSECWRPRWLRPCCTGVWRRPSEWNTLPSFERLATNNFLLRVIGFPRRLRTDHATLSYAKALKMARCESNETTIRRRRLIFAGGVARQSKKRLPTRVMCGTIAGGENPRPGGQCKIFFIIFYFFSYPIHYLRTSSSLSPSKS